MMSIKSPDKSALWFLHYQAQGKVMILLRITSIPNFVRITAKTRIAGKKSISGVINQQLA
ncbi:hypothetical protein [Yokenella regensburgei]|uniref:hypothetical protein n=1 Tax=Yokenella regensburgei TaxID=158877 RepID=UPI0013759AE9|nr:hypothetical protein [Yokenella regensburgei]KAF1371282.1 hypothetical protein FHR25_000409 [Yokenella regensburgei]